MDAKHSLGEARCLISRAALLHNVGKLRRAIAPGVKICAVVKADAYGHDADIVVDTLCNFSINDSEPPMVDALAVADIDEAASLPVCDLPIVILRPIENVYLGTQRARLEAAIHNGWIVTLCSSAAAHDLARIAQARNQRIHIQVSINTGLNRDGVDTAEFPALMEQIQKLPSLRLMGICTHFASSEAPGNPYNVEQLAQFLRVTDPHCAAGRPNRPQRSAANSGGIFFLPESHLDMVRPGIGIFGIDPTCRPSQDRHLRPALRWTAPLIGIREIPAGSTVGYGQTWTAKKTTRLGLLPVGYADGYPRALSTGGVMMIHGRPAPIAGRVSMDLTVIDLENIPQAAVGDEVIILDNDPLSPAGVYRMAELTSTIPYEIFCRIGSRVRRVAVNDFAEKTSDQFTASAGKAG